MGNAGSMTGMERINGWKDEMGGEAESASDPVP
jgi:hypothetical protein